MDLLFWAVSMSMSAVSSELSAWRTDRQLSAIFNMDHMITMWPLTYILFYLVAAVNLNYALGLNN